MRKLGRGAPPAGRWVLGALLAITVWLAASDAASALGQIQFGGCVSNDGSAATCADLPGAPMDGPQAIALSPDGNQAYVPSGNNGAVTVLGRSSPGGQLTFQGCVSDDGSGGTCADVPGTVLDGADDVAVSPDGRSVYVASFTAKSIVAFERLAGGQITFDGCVSNDGSGGICSDLPGAPLDRISSLEVAPDGGSLYASAKADVVAFGRDAGGKLTYGGCVSDDGSAGLCADVPGQPLSATESVHLSPDGKSVYVASITSTVTVFDRGAGGGITFASCVSDNTGAGNCTNPPGAPLEGATDAVVSHDGLQVYVSGYSGHSVSLFNRSEGGQLAYVGCSSNTGSGGFCRDLPDDVLIQPESLALSRDGATVYASDSYTRAVIVLDRGLDGQLTFGGCVSEDGSGGKCADVPGATMQGTSEVAISPDDGSVYVSEFASDAVDHFHRKTRPETTIDQGPAEGSRIADPRPQFAFSADQAGSAFECSLDGGAFAACTSPTAALLNDGEHSFAVRAVSGGDPDPTPAIRRFTVDTTGPAVALKLKGKPRRKVSGRSARVRFAFSSPEPGVSYECSLDDGAFTSCSAPKAVALRAGKHRFSVRAVDGLGNPGAVATKRVRVVKRS